MLLEKLFLWGKFCLLKVILLLVDFRDAKPERLIPSQIWCWEFKPSGESGWTLSGVISIHTPGKSKNVYSTVNLMTKPLKICSPSSTEVLDCLMSFKLGLTWRFCPRYILLRECVDDMRPEADRIYSVLMLPRFACGETNTVGDAFEVFCSTRITYKQKVNYVFKKSSFLLLLEPPMDIELQCKLESRVMSGTFGKHNYWQRAWFIIRMLVFAL